MTLPNLWQISLKFWQFPFWHKKTEKLYTKIKINTNTNYRQHVRFLENVLSPSLWLKNVFTKIGQLEMCVKKISNLADETDLLEAGFTSVLRQLTWGQFSARFCIGMKLCKKIGKEEPYHLATSNRSISSGNHHHKDSIQKSYHDLIVSIEFSPLGSMDTNNWYQLHTGDYW